MHAQAVGAITGTVTDPTGAVIPGAKVTATRVETGVSQFTVTTGAGTYTIPRLVVGNYNVTAQSGGFKASTATDITQDVAQQPEVDFKLALAGVTSMVEVTAAPPLVTTTNATLAQAVSGEQVQNLPLNGRNISGLMTMQPGIVPSTGTMGWNDPPRQVTASGGIFRWKDGRNMPDVHTAIFNYGDIPVYVRLTLDTETTEVARFMGSKGILELGEFEIRHFPQPGIDLAPSYYAFGFPQKMREEYFKQWHEEHDPKLGKEPIYDSTVYRGHDYDDVRPHLNTFFQAVRSRQAVTEDAVFGNHAALACHMANESYFRKKPVYWDATSQSINS